MVEGIVEFPAELQVRALVNREVLEHRHIPVVGAGPANLGLGRVADGADGRHAECIRIEIAAEGAVTFRNGGVREHYHARALARRPRNINRVRGGVTDAERLAADETGDAGNLPVVERGSVAAGPEKYDATAVSMIALLKYGSGVPWYRLQGLESHLGIPLPVATQWEIVALAAARLEPIWLELIRQAAQGQVLHNDDTGMRILRFQRAVSDPRTGLFTSGIVSVFARQRIALFFTGRQHAGENLIDLLRKRAVELPPPMQMCDALSRNAPEPLQVILGNCLAHARRYFVDVVNSFPDECRFVLETLSGVFHNDALARERELTADDRLQFHQQHSLPRMEELHAWCRRQLDELKVEPNSGLGKAIQYLLRHWPELTLFLRQAGAPLDNNLCERALKKAILHRKNALFYRTANGAKVGDLFMSLIHTAELGGVNPFDYMTELLRQPDLKTNPAQWMPWSYRATLVDSGIAA